MLWWGGRSCSMCLCVCSTVYATTRTLDDLFVVRPHLGDIFVPWTKHARTFFLRGLFWSSRNVCVCVSPRNRTKTCMGARVCVWVCVCSRQLQSTGGHDTDSETTPTQTRTGHLSAVTFSQLSRHYSQPQQSADSVTVRADRCTTLSHTHTHTR